MEQTPNTSVMPLRIALILLPAPQFDINTVEQSVLASYQTVQPELNALLNSAPTPEMLSITISDNSDANSFESQLNTATNAINNGYIVKLATATHALLMLPALKAAQMRIHPHAQLAAMQQAEVTQMNQVSDDLQPGSQALSHALSNALSQAKRSLSDVSVNECFEHLNSEQQFTEVYSLIQQLASRTHVRKAVNQGVELGPKQAKSHYWFSEFHQNRVAAINFVNGQQATSYVLTQGTGSLVPKSMLNSQRLMFILPGNSEQDIAASIAKLMQQLASLQVAETVELSLEYQQVLLSIMHDNLVNVARLFNSHNKPAYQAVIQANSFAAAKQELAALNDALTSLFAEQANATLTNKGLIQYKTPAGSYLTLTPLGNKDAQAGLAFVYPGVGTVYADMLNELHQYFPALYAKLEREGDLKSMLQAEHIYHLDPKHAANMSLGDLAIAGVGSSYLLTQLLTDEFNIKPNFALGYSMGEASMWASLGVWKNPHALISKTQTDPLFTSAISGRLTAVRQAWQLDDTAPEIQWNSFVVRSEAAPIEALLKDYPHAYLAIIQGDTCVIAGCETQCKALLAALGKRGIAANRVTAMHTQPAMQEHQNVMDFYLQPLKAELPSEIGFISAADLNQPQGQSISSSALNSQVVAKSIADTFCQTLDFTGLVHYAQHQGANLFVEIGADRQNCTLIDKIAKQDSASIAKHQPCCTVPMNAKGSQDITSVIKAIGQLISHNVPLSLQPFIDGLKRELAHCQLIAQSAAKQSTAIESNQDHLLQGEV
ncbi:eicosapentaenoate synthase subunit PfaB [uncultured Shewanella sp.]|uniref:eicosapentaenoate synthase subunit PfaB n=1 Tax=uncultured Shewanella sp. TaxID=173975 RepID=UPI0026205693|nr:eicosapentaenoate synthase subunit PfaB [uncultured Shewanella sp.]